VCAEPAANHSCTVLKNVYENKDADTEEDDRGTAWTELPRERVPPCVFERAGFMRPNAFSIVREHPYSGGWTESHAHFDKTVHRMPAYSLEATPFRWVMRGEISDRLRLWGINYDEELEEAASAIIRTPKARDWVQDHRNQLALLDSFFSGVVPERSLVFIYAKDVPLLEERPPGGRILLGVGRVKEVLPPLEWSYRGKGPLRAVIWERGVCHSIRPTFEDGFLLPYHELLRSPALQGADLDPFVAVAPADHFDEFSYVTERVEHDAAIAALTELARAVDLLPGVVDGPWDQVADWLGDRVAEAWEARGAYPGMGPVLAAAGLERGPVLAYRVLKSMTDPSANPWPALEQAVDGATRGRGPAAGLLGRMSRKRWERLRGSADEYDLVRLLSRFALSSPQARRLFDRDTRPVAPREVLENPYLAYELDRAARDAVGFRTIDRGLFPRDAAARAALDYDPLPEPVEESVDDRRIRAASVAVLEKATDEGHTLLDEAGLRKRLAKVDLDPRCDPTTDQFELAAEEFEPVLLERAVAEGRGRAWQLDRLAAVTDVIAGEVRGRIDDGPLAASASWDALIDGAIDEELPPSGDPELDLEVRARKEKAAALATLARSRIAALVGPAGTGKTTMLRALCSDPTIAGNVLLLAPTGKARVQLGDKAGAQARTLAQFLKKAERWTWERGYFLNRDGMRFGGVRTVIVDEASMLTEEMLAALIESLRAPERLILCGDHRQLPPIGAGRPFADLVAHLRATAAPESGGGVAELTIGRRQRARDGAAGARDDAAVAACFAADATPAGADQAWARVVSGGGDGTVSVISWSDEDDLHEKIADILRNDSSLQLGNGDADALKRSLGATDGPRGVSFEFGTAGRGAELWQILSPVRSRPGGVVGLNRMIRRTWRSGDAARARQTVALPDPMGPGEVLFHDKVMCVANHPRGARRIATGEDVDSDVANGEIGIAVGWPKKNGAAIGLWLEFSTQPGLRFTFWENELNRESDRADLLDVAYAITVHKAQGSQFETTFVVVPKPSALLSPELLYTASTRHRGRAVLLVQGEPMELLELSDPARSETARRLTCLFRPPDPFMTPEGRILDGSHVHRSRNEELMRSKSEVIVANTLRDLGVEYTYEELLRMPDGTVREPDFTIRRSSGPPAYWEHLGMLDLAGYRADWEAKLGWYRDHDILPWTEGGGASGTLVWSTEEGGIDSHEIENLARQAFLGSS
jgi:hypothetical protein